MKIPFTIHPSLYFALGIVMMKSVSLLMLPIVTRYLSPAEFGRLELLLSIADFASMLAGFALADALYRFAGLSKDAEQEKNIGKTVFTMACGIGLICLSVGLFLVPLALPLLGEGISLLDLQLVVFLFAVDGCLVVPLAWMKMKESAFTFFVLTTGKAICQAIISWQLLKADYGITSMLLGGAVSSLLLVVILIKIQVSQTGLGINTKLLKQILVYCSPLVISALAAFAMLSADRWVINLVTTAESLGLYAVAKKLAMIVIILMQPFGLWWSARRFKELYGPDGKTSVARFTSLGIALVLCFSTCVCITSPIIIELLIDPSYAGATIYLAPLVLFFAIKQIAELANLGCFVGRTTWSVMAIDLLTAAVSIVGLYFLSQQWLINGVIAALLIAQCVRLAAFYIVSQRILYLEYAKGKLLMLAALCLLITFVSLQVTNLGQHFVMSIVGGLLMAAYLQISGLFSFMPLLKRSLAVIRPHRLLSK
ncbi:MAG: lipopolysaccharide biosynthesis protein [Algicola sp.]|nr:lipopolysaccharide biosynthesis protein [Algicola sp.]